MSTNVKLAMVLACSALLAACAQEQPEASGNTAPPPAQTAGVPGPYDGTWLFTAEGVRGGGGDFDLEECNPVRFETQIKDNQVVGNLRSTIYPQSGANVESTPGRGATPIQGGVTPDGTLTANWQSYHATGHLSGDKGELTWKGRCGPRTATAIRTSQPAAPLAGTSRPPFSKSFGILFASDSAKLNDESRDVVRQAAAAAKDNAPARITVAGHTDTTGSSSYNQALSERRADAVRKELIADGVAEGDISASAHGESDLAVPTADHVNEPRNRRVTIQVQQPGV